MKNITRQLSFGIFAATAIAAVHADEIHSIIQDGDSKKVIHLIEANPELIKSMDDSQRTPLHLAARFGGTDLVKFLIDRGADLDARSYNDFTPLHVCSTASVAQMLVKSGSDTTLIDSWGMTALQYTVLQGRKEIAEAMIEAGAIVDLSTATAMGMNEIAEKLVRQSPELLNPKQRSALHRNESPLGIAAFVGNFELAKLYISLGADVNNTFHYSSNYGGHFTPLSNAVFAGHEELVELLLSKGADPNVKVGKFEIDLLEAIRSSGDPKMITILERARNNTAEQGATGNSGKSISRP
jgi:ankyrin repeat protein